MMKSILLKTLTLVYLCVSCRSLDIMTDSTGGIEDYPPKCFNITLSPSRRSIYDYNNEDPYRGELHNSDITYYLFNSFGGQLLSSNATTNRTDRICYVDSYGCHYLFLEGHGYLFIVDDDNVILNEGRLVFERPRLVRMGHCPHHCNGEEKQLVLVGKQGEKAGLYDGGNNSYAAREALLDTAVTKINSVDTYDDDTNVGSGEAAEAEHNNMIMKTMCFNPTGCYKLVGSAVYVLSRNDLVIEDEGTTYDGYITFGATDKCYQRCDEKPLLVETTRGQEITLTLSSVSGMESLTNVNSPHYMAACWLIHDDLRQLTVSDSNIVQRYILALLYYSFHGSEWTSNYDFLTHKDECEWTKWTYFNWLGYFFLDGNGVHCNEAGEVSKLILAENNLFGTLPSEISWLIQIEYLEFSQNHIDGSIPYEFGHLKNLENFRFRGNSLSGILPTSLGQIESLRMVDVGNNMLEGNSISISPPCNLRTIELRNNLFGGNLPDEIGRCASLEVLSLQNNLFTGTIPEGLDDLTHLERLELNGNNLSGTIPSKILTLASLRTLWVSENALSGRLPNTVTDNSSLIALRLDHNHLTGAIPLDLSLLKDMQHLDLQNNYLSGEIPSDLAKLRNLRLSSFQNNNITGNVPFETCEQFISLQADCGSPQKVSCTCCSDCHGIFKDYGDESACLSSELTIVFEGLSPGYYVNVLLMYSSGETMDSSFSAETTSHTYTTCMSTSSCFDIYFGNLTTLPFAMTVLVDDDIVANEFVTEQLSMYRFGYSSFAGGGIAKDTCDSFELCNTVFKANSTKRELINELTRIARIDVLKNTTLPYYEAACQWINFFDNNSDEDYTESKFLQYYILALIYFTTNGDEWNCSDLWLTDEAFCSWYGVSCDNHDIITAIDLSSNNLAGTLPSEIAELRGIEKLVLSTNLLSGAIPSEIGKLRNLKGLIASHNAFVGSLPSELGMLENMQIFDLYNNSFSEGIPDSFSALTGLKLLSLGLNLFAGDATGVRNCVSLEMLDLSDNFFTGSIPVIGYLSNLKVLRLSGNRFTGSIPMSIGQLHLLQEIFLHGNQLTGSLPSQFGELVSLKLASLSHNSMKGYIPSEIGNLRNLTLLHLHVNQFVGIADFFDYSIRDFIADCGHSITSPAMVACINCSACCNTDGDCLQMESTWPGSGGIIIASAIAPSPFVLLTTLGAALVLVAILFIVSLFRGANKFSTAQFQEESVYRLLLSNNCWANCLALLSVLLQLLLLFIFIAASDFTASRNDWEYSLSCPNNSIHCEDSRFITLLGWLAFSVLLLVYLLKDILEGCKMIYESIVLKSFRGILAGFVVFFVTLASIEASVLYNYSTAIKNTDILKDAAILLFLNDIDEQLYAIAQTICPKWVEDRNENIEEWFEARIRKIRGLPTVGLKDHPTKTNVDTTGHELMQEKDIEETVGEYRIHQLETELKILDSNQTVCEKEIIDLKTKNAELENKYAFLEDKNASLEREIRYLKQTLFEFVEKGTRQD